jgi:hypothetical protein
MGHVRRIGARLSGATTIPDWTYAGEHWRTPDDGDRHELLDGELLVTS